tara:strand:- start:732 stop:1013 length:282 start_codon:yes stop_codon:yes gene_type:complete
MNTLKKFLIKSYYDNKMAFYYEMASTISLIFASSVLTFASTGVGTKPEIYVPGYWLGSILGLIGAYYREATWVMILCIWFTGINSIGLWRVFG